MSIYEKQRIISEPFQDLWNNMWGETTNSQFKNEEQISFKKNQIIKEGISINDETIDLNQLVNNSTTCWKETEWEFPKGRRNFKEKDLECALREFEEETGISQTKITIIENVVPFEEIFIGTNYKSYKHKYFLAVMNNDETENILDNFQVTEVSKLEWKTIDECLESIRPYNLEKKQLITNINKVLQEYRLYS
jgi:8-oxo-dGTP pyrophosphatase MutT (NUDIX family)